MRYNLFLSLNEKIFLKTLKMDNSSNVSDEMNWKECFSNTMKNIDIFLINSKSPDFVRTMVTDQMGEKTEITMDTSNKDGIEILNNLQENFRVLFELSMKKIITSEKETEEEKMKREIYKRIYIKNTLKIRLHGILVYLIGMGTFCLIAEYFNFSFLLTLTSLFIDLNIFYLWHSLAHKKLWWIPFSDICHYFHNLHHYIYYPPSDFFGIKAVERLKKYSNSETKEKEDKKYGLFQEYGGVSNFIKNAFVALFLEFIFNFLKWYFFPIEVLVVTFIQTLSIYAIGTYLHQEFHDENSWLNKFDLFKYLRLKHNLHHLSDTKHNFSIMCFLIDIMWGTNENGRNPKIKII